MREQYIQNAPFSPMTKRPLLTIRIPIGCWASPPCSVWPCARGATPTPAVVAVFMVQELDAPPAFPGRAAGAARNPALHDEALDRLLAEMESRGDYFHRSTAHPGGLGDGDGHGRLATNTDVLKGLIWCIVQHPDGFSGEVVIVENTQDVNANWDTTPANAQDLHFSAILKHRDLDAWR